MSLNKYLRLYVLQQHYIHEKARQTSAGLLFLVTRHSCPGDYAARAKTSSLAAFAVTSFASSARLPQPYGFHITV